MPEKVIIYQILTRIFGNRNLTRKEWGTIAENGCGKFNAIKTAQLRRIRDLGATHVWYTGVLRHATQTDYSAYGIPCQHSCVVKGKAGSPYAVADYYDVDPDLAESVPDRMAEWEALIARTHKAGLKVVMDFVPNHVAREYHSIAKPQGVRDLGQDDRTDWHFSTSNNFYYCWGQPLDLSDVCSNADYEEIPAKATGNDRFTNRPSRNDWYETVKLNYGIDYCDAGGRSEHFNPVPDTWHKMCDILLYWAAKGIDAFRCDMAEMVPADFWAYATAMVKKRYPDLKFIGEVYDPNLYRKYLGAGFDWLYDKVGMYDCLRGVTCGYRSARDISGQWQATDDINCHMLYFLENHDEQRLASDFFAGDARKGIPALLVAALLRDNPFMLYAGQEFGERGMDSEGFSGRDGRTTIFDYWSLDTLYYGYFNRRKIFAERDALWTCFQHILQLANQEAAISKGLMFDLMYCNPQLQSQFAFLRRYGRGTLLIIANFASEDIKMSLKVPRAAFEYFDMSEGMVEATDLLSNGKRGLAFYADAPMEFQIPASYGVVLKFRN